MANEIVTRTGRVIVVDFGRDTWCRDSLRTGRLASGLELVAQRCYHRVTTPRGSLRGGEDEENFGIDLSAEIGALAGDGNALRLQGAIEGELRKEEVVDTVKATVSETVNGAEVAYDITIEVETAEGPFELVLAASEVSVDLLKLNIPEAA